MQADQNTVDTSLPLLNQTKRYNTSDSFQYQWADVSGSQFLYSDGTNIYFIRRTGTVPTSIYFALPNPTVIISASITESFALLTIKNPGLQVMLINCVPCIFSYSYTSGTTMSSSMYKIVNLPGSPTKWYRVTRADPEFQSGSLTSLWILDDGNAKYLTVDLVSLATTELNAMNLGSNAFMVSNNQVVLFANRTT